MLHVVELCLMSLCSGSPCDVSLCMFDCNFNCLGHSNMSVVNDRKSAESRKSSGCGARTPSSANSVRELVPCVYVEFIITVYSAFCFSGINQHAVLFVQ